MVSFTFHEEEEEGGTERGSSSNRYISNGKLLRPDVAASTSITTRISPSADVRLHSLSTNTAVVKNMSKEELNSLWMDRLFYSLRGQEMLITNARSKAHQWAGVDTDASLHVEGKRKRVLFYMGGWVSGVMVTSHILCVYSFLCVDDAL
jgi:hypothetical protein